MILKELVLHNVGTFAGKQVLNLEPPSDDKPIVLVGGLNGAGKTTILEAIQLALYGSLAPHSSGRRSGGYEGYLRSLIHRGVSTGEGAAIELSFVAYREGVAHTYRICRSWRSTGASIREIPLVYVDGKIDQALASTWNEHVETFLPRGIAGLFFFDGEQIEALADMDKSRQVLSSALAALLGLDLVDRLVSDLAVLRRRHRSDRVPPELRADVEAKRELVGIHRRAEEVAAEAVASRRNEVDLARIRFESASDRYREAGGQLLDQRESAEAAVRITRENLSRCEEEIRHELGESAPLLQLTDLLSTLAYQVADQEKSKRAEVLAEALATRDGDVLAQLRMSAVDSTVVDLIDTFLAQDREGRVPAREPESVVSGVSVADLNALMQTLLPEARRRLASAVDRRAELREELDQVERVLVSIPDSECVAPLQRKRLEARESLLRAEAGLAVATELLDAARSDRAKTDAAYEAALDKSAFASLEADDDRRLVAHVDRVSLTLAELRVEATRRHLDTISAHVLEALSVLLRKERLITDVQIDPETHTVGLTGADGHALPAAELSAGERQLLAVALLWGLARASGQPLPVVIDTPLGRLDGSHRGHLLERYFPQASHQVLLLSTDTEIDEAAFGQIAEHVGRTYRLEFDATANSTSVLPGYFWRE